MYSFKAFLLFLCLCMFSALAGAQGKKIARQRPALPYLMVVEYQEFLPGKSYEHLKLEASKSRTCDRLDVPSYWIRLEPVTGRPGAVSFHPIQSFAEIEQSRIHWRRFYSTHSDLARLQEESDSLVASERQLLAIRRDDLGYRAESVDLAEARFLRITEVHLLPGREADFVDGVRTLADASSEVNAGGPWVVYEMEMGVGTPTFLIVAPMSSLAQNDELLVKTNVSEEEGPKFAGRLEELVPDSYSSAETNLYAIRPELSHVSKEFAAGDASFWGPKAESEPKPERRADESPSNKRP